MKELTDWLAGGDVRSDGPASEVAAMVVANPHLIGDLVTGLDSDEKTIRGRTADALEKVARSRPDEMAQWLPKLLTALEGDRLPAVRFHMAMLLGHLSHQRDHVESITRALLARLEDESAFTRSWTVTSLLMIARQHPTLHADIAEALAARHPDPSKAVQSRLGRALALISDPDKPLPANWVKAEHLQSLVEVS